MLRRKEEIAEKKNLNQGQVMLEFTFSMIVVLLMIYGIMMILHWTGKSYSERNKDHEAVLTGAVSPQEQIEPYFHRPIKLNAIWYDDINL